LGQDVAVVQARGSSAWKLTRNVSKKRAKKPSTKKPDSRIRPWSEGKWKVVFGDLARGRGNPGRIDSIFNVVGEKLPKEALNYVERVVADEVGSKEGVYFAHDSLGCARYAGRGSVFSRLRSHFKAHSDELHYFSFYLIKDKKHEREIETALIRVASHLLVFNERKKRDDIEPGDVRDYESGTSYFERQRKKGRRKAAKRQRSK
jgi:hypothetical protein